MSVLIKSNGEKAFKNRKVSIGKHNFDGVPNTKKLERTGKDSFVIKADGGNTFEGKITNPNDVRFKETSPIIVRGICIRKCYNRDKECRNCFRFSKLESMEGGNAS